MGRAARALARPRAVADIADRVEEAAEGSALMFNHFTDLSRIHFVGIGGAGMSGIAEILLDYDLEVERLRPGARRGHRAAGGRWARRSRRGTRPTTWRGSTCW